MKKLYSIVCAFLLSIGLSIPVFAADTETTIDASLGWNANTELDLACYKLYKSTVSGEYGAPIVVLGKEKTSHVVAVSRGTTDIRHYFTLTACDLAGNESPKSNEVSKLIAAIATVAKPGTPVFTVVSEAPGELTVRWVDVPDGIGGIAKIDIRYGVSPILWGSLSSVVCPTGSPCKITGLLSDTLYGVKGVAFRQEPTKNVFGDITSEVTAKTLPTADLPPVSPQGLIISKEEQDEIVIVALAKDCKEVTVSAIGATDIMHKLITKCVK